MGDFAGIEDLLHDFLTEASELLSDLDNKLLELEKRPGDLDLLNNVYRDFHTIKGGAGFLNAAELVRLCHLTENLFDKLRNGELTLTPETLDAILAATAEVREMFGSLSQGSQPDAADLKLMAALQAVIDGKAPDLAKPDAAPGGGIGVAAEPDWDALYAALLEKPPAAAQPEAEAHGEGRRAADNPELEIARAGRRGTDKMAVASESTIRVDTHRLDQVLVLSGEIGLTKNRLNSLRNNILRGKTDSATLSALDQAVGQLDLLVGNLQNAVMKTRMQPIGRLFGKYPRIARDLARQLGKEVEVVLSGEETEIDKTMIEDLNDPLVHLVRNAVDHGVEEPAERAALGKPAKSVVRLQARQEGDHIVIEIADDGRGMRPEAIRAKAVEKGLIGLEEANALDDRQSLRLVFLPGFTTKREITSVSGRGVGMDVVKTNIERLNGTIDVDSEPGRGTRFTISLPLTLAILSVLIVRLGRQAFALPLSLVREILPVRAGQMQQVSGRPTLVVRGEVLPVITLSGLIGWQQEGTPEIGILMQIGASSLVLAVDGFVGHDDVVIKSLDTFRPAGVAGVTLSGDGEIVLILDIKELFQQDRGLIDAGRNHAFLTH